MEKIYKLELNSGLSVVKHNVIIKTAIKILNKHGKSVMLDFFRNWIVVIYASKRWRQVDTMYIS